MTTENFNVLLKKDCALPLRSNTNRFHTYLISASNVSLNQHSYAD